MSNYQTELIKVDTFQKRSADYKITIGDVIYIIPPKDFVNYNKVTKRVQVSGKWASENKFV